MSVKFVRYGGLSRVKQKGFSKNSDGYHSPPTRRGVYAFVEGYVETFLLGGYPQNNLKSEVVKDKKGVRIHNRHPLAKKFLEGDHDNVFFAKTKRVWPDAEPDEDGDFDYDDHVCYLTRRPKPRIFEYDGPIWHHLYAGLKKEDIIKLKGTWVKTSFDVWKKAFRKEIHRMNVFKFTGQGTYSRDHLEVFIDSKI